MKNCPTFLSLFYKCSLTEVNTSLIKPKNVNYIDINKIGLFNPNNRNST